MKFENLDLCLLRHGQTEWNVSKRVQGQLNSNLTVLGREQAQSQGEILSSFNGASERSVFCSPLGRTRETAKLALAKIDSVPVFDDRLVEINVGDWEGLLQDDIRRTDPSLFEVEPTFLSLYGIAPNGEGVDNLRHRCLDFLSDINSPSIIISHGVTITVLRGILLGLDYAEMEKWAQPQGCVIHICQSKETTHHLKA